MLGQDSLKNSFWVLTVRYFPLPEGTPSGPQRPPPGPAAHDSIGNVCSGCCTFAEQTFLIKFSMKKLQDKIAVITGATSGMALATAQLFVEEGAYVFITGRKQKELDAAVRVIGRQVTGVLCDSANLADLDHLYETVKAEKGRVDILYASAGYAEFGLPLGDITEAHYDAHFNLNAKGTLFTVQKALPLLTDGASVLLTGTANMTTVVPGTSLYSASKLALRQFVRTWSVEQKSRRIRFNIISPGPIDTPLLASLPPEAIAAIVAQVPFGHMGKPADIAAAALFLASDDSTFITGTEVNVDGGMTLH